MAVIHVDTEVEFGSLDALSGGAERLLSLLDRSTCELSVLLTSDTGIRPLNRDWRGKDSATDVLSFPQEHGVPGPNVVVLGDIVISVDTARRQAREAGHSVLDECIILLVHGLLHLLGHDHVDEGEAAAMRAEERRLLEELGIGASDGLITRADTA